MRDRHDHIRLNVPLAIRDSTMGPVCIPQALAIVPRHNYTAPGTSELNPCTVSTADITKRRNGITTDSIAVPFRHAAHRHIGFAHPTGSASRALVPPAAGQGSGASSISAGYRSCAGRSLLKRPGFAWSMADRTGVTRHPASRSA